jgi:3-ketosteroid 9alpha-monooxygenase subunit A
LRHETEVRGFCAQNPLKLLQNGSKKVLAITPKMKHVLVEHVLVARVRATAKRRLELSMTADTKTNPWAGFARGWFLLMFSEELEPGQVVPLKRFDQELVLFRTESGEAKVLDAYCPHMGAHLGHGGKIEGEGIVCPFHAWKFDGAGKCIEIPYAKRIPPKAGVACWPVAERNGMIFVWHDREKGEPDWEIPALEEWEDEKFLPWKFAKLQIKTPPLAIAENLADAGHFIPVHNTHPVPGSFSNTYTDHVGQQKIKAVAYPVHGGKDEFSSTATYYGPAYQVTKMHGKGLGVIINAHTPIDDDNLMLRFGVSMKASEGMSDELIEHFINNMRDGYLQDVQIWENKIYLDRPMLCDGDGPIGEFRRWYSQFYTPRSKAADAAE